MEPTRTQRFGKHYYRNNYVPSNSRQVLEDRLHPPGISTSSNSSWTFSNSHDIPKHKKGRLCGIFLIGAVMIVALAVIAIGGLAFYIGGHSTDKEHNVRKYQTEENIGAKRQYSNRETEATKIPDSHYALNITEATASLLETSTTEFIQTKSIPSGAILGITDTMKLLNNEVKNKKKEEATTSEMITEIPETLTEELFITEHSSFPILTTKNIEILPKNTEKPSVVNKENFFADEKIVAIENPSTKTEEIQNGHARPTYSAPQPSPTFTTISVGIFPSQKDYADEPWRPIIPSYREPIKVEHPYEEYSEKGFKHRYGPAEDFIIDNDSPITFSKKSYEQNLGISSDIKGNRNKFKKPQISRISDELVVKYKDLITRQGLEASAGIPEVVIRSDDIVTSPPRKSADVIILGGFSTASTLSTSYNTSEIIKQKYNASPHEEHTFKVNYSTPGFRVTEKAKEASPETTTVRTKITPAASTFKAILQVTSRKPYQKDSVAVSSIIIKPETLPIDKSDIKVETETVTIASTEAVTTEKLLTTSTSETLNTLKTSPSNTTEITYTTAAVNLQQQKIIKNPFADDSRSSSSSFNFGIPDLPILKQFQNLNTFLKTFGNTSEETNTTDMSKYFVKNDEDPEKVITRFPVRTKQTTAKSYKKDDFLYMEMSTTETIPKSSFSSFNLVQKNPVVVRGEVEVVSGSLKQDGQKITTEIPKLITLLPVRSNVNMMKPLRPRPKSNINSTISITDRRKPKMSSKFLTKESPTNETGNPKIYYSVPFREKFTKNDDLRTYHSSSDSRDKPKKDEKLFIVTPEPRNPESHISTEEIFSYFPENLTNLPLYNTIEALLNVDNRDRGANRNNSTGKTRESVKEPMKKNTSEIVNQIVKVVDNVVISSGDLPKIIVKVNQTMVNKTSSRLNI